MRNTWSEPIDITAQVMCPGWRQQVSTVGHAIQLRNGRLFFTAQVTIGSSRVDESQNYVFWSDDHGESWVIDPRPSAYSDLVTQQDGRIALLYERGNEGGIYYTSFLLDWLAGK